MKRNPNKCKGCLYLKKKYDYDWDEYYNVCSLLDKEVLRMSLYYDGLDDCPKRNWVYRLVHTW